MFAIALLLTAASPDPLVRTWEGTSLCQVKPSPCHDEHAIYVVSLERPLHYKTDGYKIVAGQRDFMGTFDVRLAGFELERSVVSAGRSHGTFHLTLKGSHFSGQMNQTDGRLFRLIELDKR
jgi:hypothetical protein